MVDGRAKGNNFENAVCRALSLWLFPDLDPKAKVAELPFRRRTTAIQPVEGHWEGRGDILHRPDLGHPWPFAVECKNIERWSFDGISNSEWPVWSWWQQAVNQASGGKHPFLVFTRNLKPNYVMVGVEVATCLQVEAQNGSVLHVGRPTNDPVVIALLDDLVQIPPERLASLSETSPRRSQRRSLTRRRSTKRR